MTYIKRAAEETIKKVSKMFPVLLLTGPRQVGKTTLLQKIAEDEKKIGIERKYVSLDDPSVRYLAKTDPALFLQRYSPPVLIDEIQYAPELFPYIKISADTNHRNGDFWLTSSQVFHLMKHVSESLAGRVGIMKLLGLSNSEIYGEKSEAFQTNPEFLTKRLQEKNKRDLNTIYDRIFKGSMPALYSSDDIDLETYYRSYVESYLYRDISSLSQVADTMQFYNFMTVVAAHTSKPVIYEQLALSCNISAPTAKKWLSLLVSSHIVALVQPYSNNALKRVVKMPILHFLDTGLCAYLLKWGNAETLEKGIMSGSFFESFIFSEIYKSYLNAGKEPPIYYYRDKDQKEIDLLLYQNAKLYPIEIKKSASPGKIAIRNFKAIEPVKENFIEISNGSVICMSNELLPIDEKNYYVPAYLV